MRTVSLLPLLCAGCGPSNEPDKGGADVEPTGDTAEPADSGDSGADDPGPADLVVGDVVDMETTPAGVELEVAVAGTYIAILVSTAEDQGTLYGYGSSAPEGPWPDPGTPPPSHDPPAGPPPPPADVGDTRTFTVLNGSRAVEIEATAIRVTDETVVWQDATTECPLGEIDGDTLDGVLASYEDIVLPRERLIFGEESDVDADGKMAILLSYTVNEYGAVAYVTWCDIGAGAGCGTWGNDAEIIYMGIPDPEDPYGSVDGIAETFAHEHNHLVYAWHKYVQNDQPRAEENVYLTEGMSALAQDLCGYNNGNQYVWGTALDGRDVYRDEDYSIQGVSLNDFLRDESYYDADRDGPLRGGAYLFLRYLFEQAGGMDVASDGTLTDAGGMTWLHDWFDASELGPDAVTATTGRDPVDVAMDWYTALVVTGRGLNDDPAYNYEPRVEDPLTGYEFGIDPYDTIHGWWELTGPVVQPLDEADGEIRAGGVEYLEFATEPGLVSIPVDAGAVPRARLFRIE